MQGVRMEVAWRAPQTTVKVLADISLVGLSEMTLSWVRLYSGFLRRVSRCTWHISSSGKRTQTGSAGANWSLYFLTEKNAKMRYKRLFKTHITAIQFLDFVEGSGSIRAQWDGPYMYCRRASAAFWRRRAHIAQIIGYKSGKRLLFTRTQVSRIVRFCGKASSGSRNLTVNDFWPASIIALVPCNHTLALFPITASWNMTSMFALLRRIKTRLFFSFYETNGIFLSDQEFYQLIWGFSIFSVITKLNVSVLHTPLHTHSSPFLMWILTYHI